MNIDDWADGAEDAREAVDGEVDAANMVDVDEAAVVTAWSDMDTDEIGSCSSDELYERRPNRWHGSAKAWRRMTAQDRLVARVMTRVRNRDLALHLYNTQMLKQRQEELQRVEGEREGEDKGRDGEGRIEDKERERGEGEEGDENGGDGKKEQEEQSGQRKRRRIWMPRPPWTAWPQRMGADGRRHGWDDDAADDEEYYGHGGGRARIGRPSEPLEEELTATILRLAKERFRRRVWAGPEAEDEGDRDDDGGDETSRARQTHKRRRPDVATVSATVSSDDVLSAALLRPSVRHVISQVDRALLVLHNGRAVGLRGPLADASDDSSGGEEEDHGYGRDSTTGRVGPPPLHPAWRPMTATSIDASQARLMSRWRPRDWSDVLGAAALAGFEADVVARTAQRCADLFGQSMALDTLGGEEGERGGVVGKKKRQPGRTAHRRTVYRPRPEGERYTIPDYTDEEEEKEKEKKERQKEGQSEGQNEGQNEGQTEGQKEEQGDQQKDAAETITADGQPPPLLVVYVPARKTEYEPICCPIADCPRADEGFARRTNLVRHLRIVHGAIATAKKEEATMEE